MLCIKIGFTASRHLVFILSACLSFFLNMHSMVQTGINDDVEFSRLSNLIREKCVAEFKSIGEEFPHFINSFDKNNGNTLLHVAVENGCDELVDFLVKKGIDRNYQNKDRETPLHVAARRGFVSTIRLLHNAGADINKGDRFDNTPLRQALRFLCFANPKEEEIADRSKLEEAVICLISLGAIVDESSIYYAAELGSMNILSLIIEKNERAVKELLNSYDKDPFGTGRTLLHFSSLAGRAEAVKLLLRVDRSSILEQSRSGKNVLHYAIECSRAEASQRLEVVATLIESERKLIEAPYEGSTPLCLSIMQGRPEIADLLIRRGADVNVTDPQGFTPLHNASEKGLLEVVKSIIIVNSAADPKITLGARTTTGLTALDIAVCKGYQEIVEWLTWGDSALINAPGLLGNTSLHFAVENSQNCKILESLIRKGAKVNVQNDNEDTPLHIAAKNGRSDMAKVIMGKLAEKVGTGGKGVNACNKQGNTPLHVATCHEVVKVLCEGGAATRAFNDLKQNALHCFARRGSADMIAALLARDAGFIEIPCGIEAFTPLHYAASSGNCDAIRKLLEIGAITNSRDKKGNTPLHIATLHGQKAAVKLLMMRDWKHLKMEKNLKGQLPLHQAAMIGNLDVLLELLSDEYVSCSESDLRSGNEWFLSISLSDNSYPFDNSDIKGMTPLLYAVQSGFEKGVIELVKRKIDVDPDVYDTLGTNPLHLAAEKNNFSLVRLLAISCPGFIAKKDKKGRFAQELTTVTEIKTFLDEQTRSQQD